MKLFKSLNLSFISIVLFCFVLLFNVNCVEAATTVTVYGVGSYTDTEVAVDIYADIAAGPVVSFGVRLIYEDTEISVKSALKNEDDWYFGDQTEKFPYVDPDFSQAGSVVIIGGKMDINNPMEGITGDGILLGRVEFIRQTTSLPVLSLTFGREGNFSNFVTTDRTILDDQPGGVVFLPIIFPGDSDNDGLPDDIETILNTDPFDADTDDDGIIDGNEDKNHDGIIDPLAGDTDPNNPDSDGDGIYDGTEIGLISPQDPEATDLSQGYFIPAPNPNVITDPNNPDSDGDTYDDLVEVEAGSSPVNIDSYPATTTVDLKKGFNLISITGDPVMQPDLAQDWLPVIGNSSEIEEIKVLDELSGIYEIIVPGDQSGPDIVAGEGLIVEAIQDKTVTFTSVLCSSYDLKEGINIIGIACPPNGYSAFKLLNDIGAANIASVQRFNTESGNFESAGFDNSDLPVGFDFPFVRGEGYILNMRQAVEQFETGP